VRTKASVLFATILALGGLSGLVAVPAQAIARPVHHVHYLNPNSIKNPVLRREALQAQRWELAHPGHALPVHTTWSETRHTDAPNAAGDPCTTISGTEEVKNAVDVELMSSAGHITRTSRALSFTALPMDMGSPAASIPARGTTSTTRSSSRPAC
jgi:hypothetical protein